MLILLAVISALLVVGIVVLTRRIRHNTANRKTGCVCGIADHPAHDYQRDAISLSYVSDESYVPIPTFTDEALPVAVQKLFSGAAGVDTSPYVADFGGGGSDGGGASSGWDPGTTDSGCSVDSGYSSSDSGSCNSGSSYDSGSSDSGSYDSGSSSSDY